jgi:uncharacterized protein
MAIGGVVAAPFAAWSVSRVSPALLGTACGAVSTLADGGWRPAR